MNGTGFRAQEGAAGAGLAGLVDEGLLRKGLVLAPPEALERPLRVRPRAVDLDEDWARELEGTLDAGPGARIGVAANDPALAGALAADLAARFGDAGRSVVLIDGSLEDPSIAKALPDDGDEGLVDMVSFGVSAAKGVRRTLAPGVSLVTAGSYPLSADDVFEAEAFGKILAALAADAVVLVVIPRRHLRAAGRALTGVLAIGTSADEVRALARDVPGRETVGVLVTEEGARVAEAATSRAVEESPPPTPEGGGPAPAGSEAPESVPELEPSRRSGGDADTAARDGLPPAWAAGGVITAARPHALVRRRSRAPLVVGLVVVVAAAVVGWFGVRALRESPERGARGPTHVRADEAPAGKPRAGPAGVQETRRTADGSVPGAGGEARTEAGPAGEPEPAEGGPESPTAPPVAAPAAPPSDQAERGRAAAVAIAGPGGPYALFVTSHHVESEARVEAGILEREGIQVSIVPTEVGTTGVWYRVAVSGGYPTLAAARAALAEVQKLGHEGAWIERHASSR